jgi:YVTN family beta-propeller protein
MKQIKFSFIAIALIAFAASCKKDTPSSTTPPITNGLLVLDQGNLGHNNTALTYYDSATKVSTTDYFADVNHFGLGDAGSDITEYGRKIYIVMNSSGNVTVVSASTAAFIDTISFKHSGINRGPENIVAASGKIFVSSTDGTVEVIDTTTLAITNVITVGTNPAQMAISGNNLYVSNTGAISGNYDSTLSVINLGSLTVTGTIKVGINPGPITADNSGNIYVACSGDYASINPSLVKVNTGSSTVIKSVDTAVSSILFYNNVLYALPAYGGVPVVRTLSTTDFSTVSTFITDGTIVTSPYGLDINPVNGDVYIDDAKNYTSSGEVFCFTSGGVKKFSFTTGTASTTSGINPCKVVFVHH